MEAHAIHAPAALGRLAAAGPLLRLRSDDQLVALFRMGYDEAFRVIHDRYSQRLFAYARQMLAGSRSDAEDALQDVFLRAYAALRDDDRPVTLRAWLYRVAHNRCVDHLRRPAPPPLELLALTRSLLHDPLEEVERREELRRLVLDVRRLPGQQRSALLMRELEGLSYAELADALGTTIPAVKSLLVRARIGLVEAGEARDTGCAEIRAELASAHDRGVRASGRSRRHLRDCSGCRHYRAGLRIAHHGFGALSPAHGPLATLAKLLGLGGAGSGAAAGATAGIGAGGSAAVVGGAATATATKVVAVVCCAAVVGGAARVEQRIAERHRAPAATASAPAPGTAVARRAPATAPAAPPGAARRDAPLARHRKAPGKARARVRAGATRAPTEVAAVAATPAAVRAAQPDDALAAHVTGGAAAPDEDSLPATPVSSSPGAATGPAESAAEAPASQPAGAAGPPVGAVAVAVVVAEDAAPGDGGAATPGEGAPATP